MGIAITKGPAAHGEVRDCFSNSGDGQLIPLGSQLADLHSQRIKADYRITEVAFENPKNACAHVEQARRMIEILEGCCSGSKRTQIRKAIKDWENLIARAGRS